MRPIDADALMETFKTRCVLAWVKNIVNNAPTIDAVPVVYGEWTLITSPSILYKHYRCSECGEMVYNKSLYCPNCGAKMDGGGIE